MNAPRASEGPAAPAPEAARRRLRGAPPALAPDCALFLDIDGTLLHLAVTPARVHVDGEVAVLLPALAARLGGALALITGRAIADADRLFPELALPIAGQHGCERRAANGTYHRHAAAATDLARLRYGLSELVRRHDGLLLEDKGATLALHYGLAPQLAAYVHRAVRAEVALAAAAGATLKVQRGKRIVEVKPDGRDKGTAILEFMAEPPFRGRRPVFAGDDLTDELGFAAVQRLGGWAVKVGPGATRAHHRLPDVDAVRQWLAAALRGETA
ncbi:MAG: trehalose-phosphatase [Betaproteobacteria bacterium]